MAGRVAVVTGAASGIGEATCRRLTDEGAVVVGLDLRPAAQVGHLADVCDGSLVQRAVDEVVEAHGRVDVLANVAGIGAIGTVLDNSEDEWWRVLGVNVLGVVNASRAVIPHMQRAGGGSIVNISSVVALIGTPQRVLYSASKGAVSALTRAMAADHLREGIRVNAVCPGPTDTPWVRSRFVGRADPAQALAQLGASQPMGRLATANEIAGAVAFLASDEAAFITGTDFLIDGGISRVRTPSRPSS